MRSPCSILADELAREADAMPDTTLVGSVGVAAPGSSTSPLRRSSPGRWVGGILASPATRGRVPATRPRSVNVEFVRPTRRSLTIGNARGRSWGTCSAGCSKPAASGVVREYYFNDSGSQGLKLGASVIALDPTAARPGRRS